jgi:hypothetical protein
MKLRWMALTIQVESNERTDDKVRPADSSVNGDTVTTRTFSRRGGRLRSENIIRAEHGKSADRGRAMQTGVMPTADQFAPQLK